MGVVMNFKEIQKFVKKGEYLFSDHGDEERIEDGFSVDEVEEAIIAGEVISERLDDPRGESRLISGVCKNGRIIHIVIGLRLGRPIIVTVYIPTEDKWIYGKIRHGKGD